MSAKSHFRPVYLPAGSERFFGLLANPPGGDREVAVLIVPPFGWDDVCSYRGRHDWAVHLAEADRPCLRIDLPGTGDSTGSPQNDGRVEAWIEATAVASRWLRQETGCRRICAIGLGLGGLLACLAAADGAPIDELVLWSAPARGASLLRELRAFSRLEETSYAQTGADPIDPLPEGYTETAGFMLTPETRDALKAIDLGDSPALPATRRALVLDRDGIAADKKLVDHLRSIGLDVALASGEGWNAMMDAPGLGRPPVETFRRVDAWLSESQPNRTTQSPNGEKLLAADAVEFEWDGRAVRETPLRVTHPSGDLFCILSEPVDGARLDASAVLLNAGAVRRIGPNRMWVEMSRRWAARGLPTVRVDLGGIGDSEGDASRYYEVSQLYVPELANEAIAILDMLERRGFPPRFALGGLCAGAYWAFHVALQDDRVASAYMINPRVLFWDKLMVALRETRKLRKLGQESTWRRILSGEVPLSRMAELARYFGRWLVHAPGRAMRNARERARARAAGGDEVDLSFDRLRDGEKSVLLMFTFGEPLRDELERDGHLARLDRWPNMRLDLLGGSSHTLRPVNLQRQAHGLLDEALERDFGMQRERTKA